MNSQLIIALNSRNLSRVKNFITYLISLNPSSNSIWDQNACPYFVSVFLPSTGGQGNKRRTTTKWRQTWDKRSKNDGLSDVCPRFVGRCGRALIPSVHRWPNYKLVQIASEYNYHSYGYLRRSCTCFTYQPFYWNRLFAKPLGCKLITNWKE